MKEIHLVVGILAFVSTAACGTGEPSGLDGGADGASWPSRIDPSIKPADLVMEAHEAPPEPVLPDGVRVKALSLNIYGNKKATPEQIGAFLKGRSADVVGLQECDEKVLPGIAAAAGYQHFAGRGQCVLSKTQILDYGMASEEPGRELVHYNTVIGGVTFSVYNAHTSWNADGNIECRWMVDEVLSKDPNPYKLMTGDFNDEELSSQIDILDEVLADVFTKYGLFPGERISWPSTGFDDTEGSQLIDLIFVPKGPAAVVVSADVLNLRPVLSDHKPVTADILYQSDLSSPSPDPYETERSVWALLPPEGSRPPNLLTNPGAEDGTVGWEVKYGGAAVSKRQNRVPRTGGAFFTGFEARAKDWPQVSTGAQTVDISAHARAIDERRGRICTYGWITTGYEIEEKDGMTSNIVKPYDEGEVVVDALGADDSVLATYVSKRRDTLKWHPFAGVVDAPPGTRKVRLTWVSHHKDQNGPGNDAMFDDLYLGFEELTAAHKVVAGNLLSNPGAEKGTTVGWKPTGWQAQSDGEQCGLSYFEVTSFSGAYYFFAGGPIGLEPGRQGISELGQAVSLDAFRKEILLPGLAVRWGGAFRTWDGSNTVRPVLIVYDGDGSEWGAIEGDDIFDPEWRHLEYLTRIPAGASAVKPAIRSDVSVLWNAAFADELYVIPEIADAAVK